MAAAEALRVNADALEQPKMAEIYRLLIREGKAALIGPDGTQIEVPHSIYNVLLKVVETMQQGKSIAVMPIMQQCSTQAAADFLGVSRQFLVREVEAGKMPVHYVGTHRRLYLRDILDYREKRMLARRSSVERIARKSEELGDYDKFVQPDEEG